MKLHVVEGNARALAGMWEEVEKCARYQALEPRSEDAPMLEEIQEAGRRERSIDSAFDG